MGLTLPRAASVTGVAIALMAALVGLSSCQRGDVIPTEFRGNWVDQGAECGDTEAQVRITASTIDYDQLSFKADGVAGKGEEAVSLTGEAFPGGKTVRETVQLRMEDHRARLLITARNLPRPGPFVRCPSRDGA
jgi:hypothetical protein